MAVISRDLGPVTAYAAAVNRGYTGTREEFETLMASYATVAQEAGESASAAADSASDAESSASAAATSASDASSFASAANTSASNASNAATAAGIAQTAAESARDAAQSAQTAAEAAQEGAEAAVDGFDSAVTQAISDVNAAGTNQKELAKRQAEKSEAWAVGQISGEDVGVSDPAYHNNAKYYADVAGTSATTATTKAGEAAQSAANAAASASAAAESARTLTIDATLTQAGQAADSKAVGDKIAYLGNEVNHFNGGSVNLLDPSEFIEGKYLVDGGGLSDNSGLTASGFFEVEENTTYYLYRSDTYQVRVCFYTDNSIEGYIYRSLINVTSSTPTFTTPATAKYARISTNKNMILDMGVYVTDVRYYVPYRILLANGIGIDNQLDTTLTDSKKASPADVVGEIKKYVAFPEKCIKYGDSGMIVDERLDLTSGNIVTNSSNQTRTDFIPVSVGDYLQTCAIRYICLYNNQFEYLGYINLWSSNGSVAPPTSWSGNYRSNIVQIEAIDGANPSYVRCWGAYNQYPPAISFLDGNPYEVLNLGDSIFGNNEKPWDLGTYIQNITGLKSANCGYGGTTARVITSGNMSPLGLPSIVDCIVAEDFTPLKTPSYWAGVGEYMYTVPTLLFPMVDFSKIKIITIAYGTNDYNSNTPLDNTENRLDTSTYCGGLRYAIEHLQAKYPDIIIMLFSPIYRYWSDSSDYSTVDRDGDSRTNTLGLKLTDYVDAMKSVADEYHLPYFDNYRNIGLNRYTAPAWLRDGTHLNRARGVEKLGHRVAREVETVY